MAIDDLSALETRPALSRSRRHPPITIKRWPGAAAACLISPTVAADTEPHLRCLPPASVNRQRSYAAIQGTDAESCCAVGDLNVSEMLAALPFERTMRPSVTAPGHWFGFSDQTCDLSGERSTWPGRGSFYFFGIFLSGEWWTVLSIST